MKCENFCFYLKFSWKSFGVSKNSRTFASAFALKTATGAQKKEFFEKSYIKQRSSSTRSEVEILRVI